MTISMTKTTPTPTRYIVVWRRSPTSRFLDVQTSPDADEIAVFTDPEARVITDESELVEYVNGSDTETQRVEAGLAHRVLGWNIP